MSEVFNQFKNYKVEDQDMTKKWKAAGESEEVKATKQAIEDQRKAEELGLSKSQLAFYNQLLAEGNHELADQLVRSSQVRAVASKYPSTKVGWDQMKSTNPSLYYSSEAMEARKAAMKDFAIFHSSK